MLRLLDPLDGVPNPFHQITGIPIGGALGDGLALDGCDQFLGGQTAEGMDPVVGVGQCPYCGLLLGLGQLGHQ